jgi:hypothetical protein
VSLTEYASFTSNKAILSKFGSGKEKDKLNAYLRMLKVGPSLLKFVPGKKQETCEHSYANGKESIVLNVA